MFCSECGKQVEDNAKFCGECGAQQAHIDSIEMNSNLAAKDLNNASQKKSLLKVAAIIIGCIWGFFILVGWIAYSQIQNDIYGISQTVKPAAFMALMIQTILASLLLFFGFKK